LDYFFTGKMGFELLGIGYAPVMDLLGIQGCTPPTPSLGKEEGASRGGGGNSLSNPFFQFGKAIYLVTVTTIMP
jgi:hypothetical protein